MGINGILLGWSVLQPCHNNLLLWSEAFFKSPFGCNRKQGRLSSSRPAQVDPGMQVKIS